MSDAQARNPDHLREISRQIASVVIISSDGKLLMGRKDPKKGGVYPDAWHIPGGGIEEGESLEATARREAYEEVGIDLMHTRLKPLPFVGQGETVKTLATGEQVWVKMTFHRFEAKLDKPASEIDLNPGDDLTELRWFDQHELSSAQQIPGGKAFFIQAGYIKSKA